MRRQRRYRGGERRHVLAQRVDAPVQVSRRGLFRHAASIIRGVVRERRRRRLRPQAAAGRVAAAQQAERESNAKHDEDVPFHESSGVSAPASRRAPRRRPRLRHPLPPYYARARSPPSGDKPLGAHSHVSRIPAIMKGKVSRFRLPSPRRCRREASARGLRPPRRRSAGSASRSSLPRAHDCPVDREVVHLMRGQLVRRRAQRRSSGKALPGSPAGCAAWGRNSARVRSVRRRPAHRAALREVGNDAGRLELFRIASLLHVPDRLMEESPSR